MKSHNIEFIAIPERFCGIRVLLVGPDETSVKYHAHILSQNSYRVTTTPDVAAAMWKLLNGESYDCVLIDADIPEMDMVDFLHQTFKHQPHLSIIMMTSNNIDMRLFKEILQNEAVVCLPKPCNPRDICNIWQHVCRKGISFEGVNYSNGESPEENQEPNIFKRFDPVVKKSTTINPTLMNHSLSSSSSGSGTQDGLGINSQESGAMCKLLTYEELWRNDDDHDQEHVDENNTIVTMKNVDKGKQPNEHKRTNDRQVEDDHRYCKQRKDTKKRITWTGDLHRKFVEAINLLGKEKAYPTTILDVMKVPGLTRSQVSSHLQKYQDHKKNIKNPTLVPQNQRGSSSRKVKNLCGQSTVSDQNYASILPSSQQPLKLNSTGIYFMSISNIKARLQEAPSLLVPQPTTTINNPNSNQSTNTSFCHPIHAFGPVESCNSTTGKRNEVQNTGNGYGSATGPCGEVVAPLDATSFSNGFISHNSPAQVDYSGTAFETWVSRTTPSDYGIGTALEPLEAFAFSGDDRNIEMPEILNLFGMTNSAGGGISASSNDYYPKHLVTPKFVSRNLDRESGDNLFPTFLHYDS
ncbi:hypothetical protein LXL04_021315 [Taraxacum kok-saghyz]